MKKFLVLAVMGVFMTGCATLISGSKQSISISANVDGADVSIVDIKENKETYLGKTPYIGEAPRLKQAKIVVKKEGYKTAEILLESDTNMAFLVNIFCSGVFGTSTDFSSGAIYKYAPGSYMANLAPGKKTADIKKFNKESSMRIFALLNYDRICGDLAVGNGQYLDSIYALYGAKDELSKKDILGFVRKTQNESASTPEFAQRLSERM